MRIRFLLVFVLSSAIALDVAQCAPPEDEQSPVRFVWKKGGHSREINAVAWSAQGNVIASASDDQSIKVWQIQNGSLLRTLAGHAGDVHSLAFTPQRNMLLSASDDGTIRAWNVLNGESVYAVVEGDPFDDDDKVNLRCMALSADGGRIAVGMQFIDYFDSDNGFDYWTYYTILRIRDARDGTLLQTFTRQDADSRFTTNAPAGIHSMAIAPDASYVVSGGEDGISIWNMANGTQTGLLTGHKEIVRALAFNPTGNLLASADHDPNIKLWSMPAGTLIGVIGNHTERVRSMAFSSDGSKLVSASFDRTIQIWDLQKNSVERTINDSDEVRAVAWSPNEQRLVSGNKSDQVKIWSARDGQLENRLGYHGGKIVQVAVSPDDRFVASASGGEDEHSVRTWRSHGGQALGYFPIDEEIVALGYSADGAELGVATRKEIQLMRASDGLALRHVPVSGATPGDMFSPGLVFLTTRVALQDPVTFKQYTVINLWKVSDGSLWRTLQLENLGASVITFSFDGKLLSAQDQSSGEKVVKVWRIEDGQLLHSIPTGLIGDIGALNFSPDGQSLAAGNIVSAESTIKIWRVADGALLKGFQGQFGGVSSLAFSLSGALLFSGGIEAATVIVWRLADDAAFPTHEEALEVRSFAFGKDGRSVYWGRRDATVIGAALQPFLE